MEGIQFCSIFSDLSICLERDFEEQISKAFQDYARKKKKASGPDGFHFAFIKATQGVLKEDFREILSEFLCRGQPSKENNVTLIPKINNVVDLKDSKPISLASSVYKLLPKILLIT